MKSENTTSDLHTQGKPDKELSMSFNENDFILEELRKVRNYYSNKYTVASCSGGLSPKRLLLKYWHKKYLKAKKIHIEQFKKTRDIYQQSDEYKKTRGY